MCRGPGPGAWPPREISMGYLMWAALVPIIAIGDLAFAVCAPKAYLESSTPIALHPHVIFAAVALGNESSPHNPPRTAAMSLGSARHVKCRCPCIQTVRCQSPDGVYSSRVLLVNGHSRWYLKRSYMTAEHQSWNTTIPLTRVCASGYLRQKVLQHEATTKYS